MSWCPTFFVRKGDAPVEYLLEEGCHVWEFRIGTLEGYVVVLTNSTSNNRAIHELLAMVPHWILNDEEAECSNCLDWGKEVTLEALRGKP